MKIIAISLARNEQDIIEAFLRYHSSVLDEIILVDHHSADSTLAIAKRLVTPTNFSSHLTARWTTVSQG